MAGHINGPHDGLLEAQGAKWRTQLSAWADTRRSASSHTALAAALPSAAMSAITGASQTRTSSVRLRTCAVSYRLLHTRASLALVWLSLMICHT